MKRIDLFAPTRNRRLKLGRMLASLPNRQLFKRETGIDLVVTIVCDGDLETSRELLSMDGAVDRVLYLARQHGSVAARNLITQTVDDALLYATDDIEFKPAALEAAARAMQRQFLDDDGVVGFVQVGTPKYSRVGVALIGQKFLRRYPDRKLFFPGYWHFSCQEIERLAAGLHRLFLCPEAVVHHHHPSFEPDERDSTHVEARARRVKDKAISSARAAKGLTWGS